ncbi:hypothetical protein GWI33_019699 [Rhynchophorus ferrugineus]|uniref:Uncharacterized protein n=1 Tax=Rhynchophorus ferrugineus TaxID=354439 RepID=A0A834M092_RHYFE|nr:hypothetical protein GWI33_019699 [Rhynchophorus ferrugineus]
MVLSCLGPLGSAPWRKSAESAGAREAHTALHKTKNRQREIRGTWLERMTTPATERKRNRNEFITGYALRLVIRRERSEIRCRYSFLKPFTSFPVKSSKRRRDFAYTKTVVSSKHQVFTGKIHNAHSFVKYTKIA